MDTLDKYIERFGEIDTFSLLAHTDVDQLLSRMEQALKEGVPIDIEKEYGLEPPPEDALL